MGPKLKKQMKSYRDAGCTLVKRKGDLLLWDCPKGPPSDCGCGKKPKRSRRRARS